MPPRRIQRLAEAAQRATEREIERAWSEHRQRVDTETATHAKVIADERRASDEDRKIAAAARQTAENDARRAAELKQLWDRKLAAFEGTK